MINRKEKKILIVYKGSITDSTAASNRVISLANGLHLAGEKISIYNSTPPLKDISESSVRNVKVNYHFTPLHLRKVSRALKVIIGMLLKLPKLIIREKPHFIYYYGDDFYQIKMLLFYRYFFNFKFVIENTEYPHILLRKSSFKKFIGKYLVHFTYRRLDGFIVISNALLEFYKQHTSPRTKFLIVNMTVDTDRFSQKSASPFPNNRYIAYCGSFNQQKDGINSLLESFLQIQDRLPDIKLILIGKGTTDEELFIEEFITKNNLSSHIVKTGYLDRNKIPTYLNNAELLVLPRPTSLQAAGGFPSKLGEYLATGKPVLVTNTGEISHFLKNNYNSFLVAPDSVDAITNGIYSAFRNYANSQKIGQEGYKTVLAHFNSEIESKKIADFLHSI